MYVVRFSYLYKWFYFDRSIVKPSPRLNTGASTSTFISSTTSRVMISGFPRRAVVQLTRPGARSVPSHDASWLVFAPVSCCVELPTSTWFCDICSSSFGYCHFTSAWLSEMACLWCLEPPQELAVWPFVQGWWPLLVTCPAHVATGSVSSSA